LRHRHSALKRIGGVYEMVTSCALLASIIDGDDGAGVT
jgi:hypothetical protein